MEFSRQSSSAFEGHTAKGDSASSMKSGSVNSPLTRTSMFATSSIDTGSGMTKITLVTLHFTMPGPAITVSSILCEQLLCPERNKETGLHVPSDIDTRTTSHTLHVTVGFGDGWGDYQMDEEHLWAASRSVPGS